MKIDSKALILIAVGIVLLCIAKLMPNKNVGTFVLSNDRMVKLNTTTGQSWHLIDSGNGLIWQPIEDGPVGKLKFIDQNKGSGGE